jgi:predicted TIM-barrel fold metal-dependent hydrolase
MTLVENSPETRTDNYVVISADTHAGASHATYREYLDPKYRDDFDAWRGEYKNPYKDLGDNRRLRNWDTEMRDAAQLGDGVVGEVIFPNTVPPFFPTFVLFAQPPEAGDYEHRLAGIRAHNRWLKDFCDEQPDRRAGVGQIFLNNVDDAIEDALWIKENGLRGGVLLPNIAPDVKWVKPLYDPCYDPLWEVLSDLEIPVNAHGGTGNPNYGKYPFSMLLYIEEVSYYSQRPLVYFILSGVFERFPNLRFVLTETGSAWIPGVLQKLDRTLSTIRDTGETGEIKYDRGTLPQRSALEYFHQNCWLGVSNPGAADMATRDLLGIDRYMWGSDYPHDEGTNPHTKELLRGHFADVDPLSTRKILSENAAELYNFDLDALQKLADVHGMSPAELHEPLDISHLPSMKDLGDDMNAEAL